MAIKLRFVLRRTLGVLAVGSLIAGVGGVIGLAVHDVLYGEMVAFLACAATVAVFGVVTFAIWCLEG